MQKVSLLMLVLVLSITVALDNEAVRNVSAIPKYGPPQGFVGTMNPQNMVTSIAIDNGGTVYWSTYDSSREYSELLKRSARATSRDAPIVVLSGLKHVLGIGVDAVGNLYYSEYSLGRLYELPVSSNTPSILLGSLNYPSSISVDASGGVYFITSPRSRLPLGPCGGDKIAKYSASTGALTTVLTAPTLQWWDQKKYTSNDHGYYSLFIHSSGDLYFTDCDGTISRLPNNSSTPQIITTTGRVAPAIVVDGEGNIFYTENSFVYMLPVGSTFWTAPITVNGDGVWTVNQMALDAEGNIYTARGDTILKIPKTGVSTKTQSINVPQSPHWGEPYVFGLNPQVFTVDDGGNIFLIDYSATDSGTPNAQLLEIPASQNQPIIPILLTAELPRGIVGLAIDSRKNIYFAADNYRTPNSGQLGRWSPDGKTASVLVSSLNHPGGISVDSFGNVYVLNDNPAAVITRDYVINNGKGCWRSIIKFNTNLGSTQTVLSSASGYRAIDVDSKGNLYFVSCILHYSTSNQYPPPPPTETSSIEMLPANSSIPQTIISRNDFCLISALSVDQDGNIFFTKCYEGIQLLPSGSKNPISLGGQQSCYQVSCMIRLIAIEKQGDTLYYVTTSYWQSPHGNVMVIWRVPGFLSRETSLKATSTVRSMSVTSSLPTVVGNLAANAPLIGTLIVGGFIALIAAVILARRRKITKDKQLQTQ